jgi:hypothetical protein
VKDNDLSASLTYRYWVLAEVVFRSDETTTTSKTGWFKSLRTSRITVMPDLMTLSMLWQFSVSSGARMELVFIGDYARDAVSLWEMLEKSAANPFYDWHAMEDTNKILEVLPYRPDLLGIIDLPERSARYGGKGLTTANLH